MEVAAKKQEPGDEEREARIHNEIIVDAYGPEEQALSWYYYLDEALSFPFLGECIAECAVSPLRAGEKAEVIGMAPEEACEHGMVVMVRWRGRRFALPLSQLIGVNCDESTRQAIADWRYWTARGCEL
jgi:hypothetical protein